MDLASASASGTSVGVRAWTGSSWIPNCSALGWIAPRTIAAPGLSGFHSMPIREGFGINSNSSSTFFCTNSGARKDTPVTFPPGRARLATSPSRTGSLTPTITIGTVPLARLAAIVAAVPRAMITATFCRTRATAPLSRSGPLTTLITKGGLKREPPATRLDSRDNGLGKKQAGSTLRPSLAACPTSPLLAG